MIMNGHQACSRTNRFRRLFRATTVSATAANNRACANSLMRHTWTFDDGLSSVSEIFSVDFAPSQLVFQLFVCPELTDAWEHGRVAYVRQRLQNQSAELLTWDEIGRLVEGGIIIGSHGLDHSSFSGMEEAWQVEQFERSREMIRVRTGQSPTSFAFPFGRVAPSSVEAAVFAKKWYGAVYLSDNSLPIGELAGGVFNRRHGEFGACAYRGMFIGALNIMFGIRPWRSS